MPGVETEAALAAAMLFALTAYALLGGADFGGGVWDLVAFGPRREEQRRLIARAMGPVWEANHVWLIFFLVLLLTAFPRALAALGVALYLPLHLVLLGIVLRGAAFVFRWHGGRAVPLRQAWGSVFGGASVVTPFLLGAALGAVSSGGIRVTAEGVSAPPAASWLHPFALATGALAVAICAYLAAVYLTVEADGPLRRDFRNAALAAVAAVAFLAFNTLFIMARAAPHLWQGFLRPPGSALLAAGALLALAAVWALRREAYVLARAAAAAQVAVLLWGWALAQWPYLVYPDLTVVTAAAPEPVLRFTLALLAPGLLVVLPSLWLLFAVFKR